MQKIWGAFATVRYFPTVAKCGGHLMVSYETGLLGRAHSLWHGTAFIVRETGPLALALRLFLVVDLVLLGATVGALVWHRPTSTLPSAQQITPAPPRPAPAAPKNAAAPKSATVDLKPAAFVPRPGR